jgi:hypothetical protein
MIHSSNPIITRILRTGLATPALALTIVAGAAMAQQGGGAGRAYEVIIETEPQDKADEAPRARASNQQSQVVVEVQKESDGNTVSVRRVNDEPIVVKLNGKVLSKDAYTLKNGVVVIKTDGHTFEVKMPEQYAVAESANPFAGRIRLAEPAAPLPPQIRGNAGGGTWALAQDAPMAQPKVMLGVVMGEPEATTVEHLGLDAKKVVLLERVVDGLPAAKAGLQDKDIIVGFGENAEPRSADEIRKVLSKAEPGTVVKVKVIRKGHPVTVDLKLEAFDAQALGRATMASGGGAGQLQLAPKPDWRGFEMEHEDHQEHLLRAEQAMKEAAEMLARMEHEIDRSAVDAHAKASKAIEKAIAAMKEGEAYGLEIEDMRRIQEEAVARLRNELGARGENQRFWAQPGDGGEGFALTFPSQDDRQQDWADRLAELEGRLDQLENSLDRAINRLETRTEAMMERLMDRLERALEAREGDRR